MFDTWSKNNEQKCWADLDMRRHPGSCLSDFLSRYSYDLQYNRGSVVSWCVMARCREHRQGETFITHLPQKYPLEHNHKTKTRNPKKKKKKRIQKIWLLFTQLPLIFLDLNYKHTSIFQLHISPTYRVPLGHYPLLRLLKTLVPTVLWRIYRVAVWYTRWGSKTGVRSALL